MAVRGVERYFKFCVIRVIVLADMTMKFYVTWELNFVSGAIKISDVKNSDIYITDNLGNNYAFIQAGSGAASDVAVVTG